MNHLLEIHIELYKRGDYSQLRLSDKQLECLKYLNDDELSDIVFGGGAGGGKTWLGCVWLLFQCLSYEDVRYYIGREKLKRLKTTTFLTFKKVCKEYGVSDSLWNYNDKMGCIYFSNGSRIDFLDLMYLPRDPLFERYGSEEFTGGFIEEGGEIHFDAYDTLKSRVGRQKNKDYKLKKKTLITCNPKKNWLYKYFYKPNKEGTLKKGLKFLQSLVTDNIYIDPDYIEGLKSLTNKSKKERLLKGNWDYDDDPHSLCSYEDICNVFTNDHVLRGDKRISADLAMKGRDRFVSGFWEGTVVTIDIDKLECGAKEIENDLKYQKTHRKVPNSKMVADSDGLGAYLEAYIKNIVEFRGNKRAQSKKYRSIKDQCGFKLGEIINNHQLHIICSPSQEESIKEEISVCLKEKDIDDSVKELIDKKEMKELLGHSPDYLDMLIMGMYFEIYKQVIFKKR